MRFFAKGYALRRPSFDFKCRRRRPITDGAPWSCREGDLNFMQNDKLRNVAIIAHVVGAKSV